MSSSHERAPDDDDPAHGALDAAPSVASAPRRPSALPTLPPMCLCSTCGRDMAAEAAWHDEVRCSWCGAAQTSMLDGFSEGTTVPTEIGGLAVIDEIAAGVFLVDPRGLDTFDAGAGEDSPAAASAAWGAVALVEGGCAELQRERAALEATALVGGVAKVRGQVNDPRRGPHLVVELPIATGLASHRVDASSVRPRTTENTTASQLAWGLAAAKGALEVALELARHGLAVAPLADDLVATPSGFAWLRMRGVTRLGASQMADASTILAALRAHLLPWPCALSTTPMVRILCAEGPPRGAPVGLAEAVATVDEAMASTRARDDTSPAAEASDVGLRRASNQDATAAAWGELGGRAWAALVVCDGVSSSPASDRTARIGADVVSRAFEAAARSGGASRRSVERAVVAGIAAAHEAACIDGAGDAGVPPGSTVVAALALGDAATVGWVGDSRCYLIRGDVVDLLTHDHVQPDEDFGEPVDAGASVSRPGAARRSHALSRCIGPLEVATTGAAPAIDVITTSLEVDDVLVLCSDGLWGHLADAHELASLVRAMGPRAAPAAVARALVHVALARGGHDNASVVVYRVP